MKKTIYLLLLAFLFAFQEMQAQQMPAPDPNTPNVLYLKFSKALNTEYALTEARVRSANGVDREWQDLYLFTSESDNGESINHNLYTLDKNYFTYANISLYNSVAITNDQLRDILSPKESSDRHAYIDNFSHIYIIDLDTPDPRRPDYYKIIEVKPYYLSKH